MIKKISVFSLLLLTFSCYVSAQNLKYYLDKDDQITDSAKAISYLVVFEKASNDSLYRMRQFSLDNLLMVSGAFWDAELSIPHGTYYYYTILREMEKNRKINFLDTVLRKPTAHFLEKNGDFIKGKMNGVWTTYYDNGKVKQIETFNLDELEGKFQLFTPNGDLTKEGNYHKNLKEGKWIDNGGLYEIEYVQGKEVKRTKNKKVEAEKEAERKERTKYDVSAKPPGDFIGQLRAFMRAENTNDIALEKASVTFTVDEEGNISEPKVSGLSDFTLMAKIKEFFKKASKWHPATTGKNKIPVKSLMFYTLAY